MKKIVFCVALMALIGCEGSKVESSNSELVSKVFELESRLSINEAELFEIKKEPGYRELTLVKFPFVIIYEIMRRDHA